MLVYAIPDSYTTLILMKALHWILTNCRSFLGLIIITDTSSVKATVNEIFF